MNQHKAKSAEARPASRRAAALPPLKLPPLLALRGLTSTSSTLKRAFRHPPTPWGLVCGSYDSPPLSFPSPLKPKTWVMWVFRGGWGGAQEGGGSKIFA